MVTIDNSKPTGFIWCKCHGWLAKGEEPHTSKKCKSFVKTKSKGKDFETKNQDVMDYLNSVSTGKTSKSSKKYQGQPKKHPKIALKWKKERQSGSSETLDKLSSSFKKKMELAMNDVDITLIKPADARLGFGQHKSQTYANVVKKEPGYLSWMCTIDMDDTTCPSARAFYRWCLYAGHIKPKDELAAIETKNKGAKKVSKKSTTVRSLENTKSNDEIITNENMGKKKRSRKDLESESVSMKKRKKISQIDDFFTKKSKEQDSDEDWNGSD